MTRVGVIGVGNMGLPMLRALHRAGFEVIARDLRAEAQALALAAGARLAGSAGELARACDMILVVVVDAGQVDDVLFREASPACAGLQPGTVVGVCSTIAPEDAERIAEGIARAGGLAIDMPMSGGPARAEAGKLALMLAADDAALDRADEVLAALADRRFRISSRPGDGARMKLANNLLAGINLAAGAEVLAMGERIGLDPATMLAVIGASSGQSWIVDDRLPRAVAGDFAPRAHASILDKDMGLALAMAAAASCPATLGEPARALFARSLALGWGGEDDAVLLRTAQRAIGAKNEG